MLSVKRQTRVWIRGSCVFSLWTVTVVCANYSLRVSLLELIRTDQPVSLRRHHIQTHLCFLPPLQSLLINYTAVHSHVHLTECSKRTCSQRGFFISTRHHRALGQTPLESLLKDLKRLLKDRNFFLSLVVFEVKSRGLGGSGQIDFRFDM